MLTEHPALHGSAVRYARCFPVPTLARTWANTRNSGLSSHNPMAASAPKDRAAVPMRCQRGEVGSYTNSVGARNATTANNGTINRSSNSKMDTMRCPPRLGYVTAFREDLHNQGRGCGYKTGRSFSLSAPQRAASHPFICTDGVGMA